MLDTITGSPAELVYPKLGYTNVSFLFIFTVFVCKEWSLIGS